MAYKSETLVLSVWEAVVLDSTEKNKGHIANQLLGGGSVWTFQKRLVDQDLFEWSINRHYIIKWAVERWLL